MQATSVWHQSQNLSCLSGIRVDCQGMCRICPPARLSALNWWRKTHRNFLPEMLHQGRIWQYSWQHHKIPVWGFCWQHRENFKLRQEIQNIRYALHTFSAQSAQDTRNEDMLRAVLELATAEGTKWMSWSIDNTRMLSRKIWGCATYLILGRMGHSNISSRNPMICSSRSDALMPIISRICSPWNGMLFSRRGSELKKLADGEPPCKRACIKPRRWGLDMDCFNSVKAAHMPGCGPWAATAYT